MTETPRDVVLQVYDQGWDLRRPDHGTRFTEAVAKALAAWDVGGLWGHVADAGALRWHARDRVQALAGAHVGIWRIVTADGKPTWEYVGPPNGQTWFEEL